MYQVLFLYLKAFSMTGGIEKFNRSFLKALHELSVEGHINARAISPYESTSDARYWPAGRLLNGFGNKILFALKTIWVSRKCEVLVLGHIHLMPVARLVRLFRPRIRVVLIVHGIEVWRTYTRSERAMLLKCHAIWSVSEYTRGRMRQSFPDLIQVPMGIFPNTIDPYFSIPADFSGRERLRHRYGIPDGAKVILTITRILTSEKYKGYDVILRALAMESSPRDLFYVLGGKSEQRERERIEALAASLGVRDRLIMTGFIADEEIGDHYRMADVFVMPSKKEGFGIVFIEALACGVPVIAGDQDGSKEAVLNGDLGLLVNPDSAPHVLAAIQQQLSTKPVAPEELHDRVMDKFGFERFKRRLLHNLSSQVRS
ncbi:MAG: glycosyltransferase family 4 protein [Cyclobacteriaceae bacterium]